MKPTPLRPSLPGVPSPSPPPHKLELQTLKLEELTVSAGRNPPPQAGPLSAVGAQTWVRRRLIPHKCPIGGPVAWSLLSRFPIVQPRPLPVPRSPPSTACPHSPPQVSELRQQLRLRGLPVSGTKSMLLERMRGGAPPRERPQPRRQGCPGGASWPRRTPEAPRGASARVGRCTCGPTRRSHSGTGRKVGKRVGNDVGGRG